MIEVRKNNEQGYYFKIDDAQFLINPAKIYSGSYIILSQGDIDINKDTIFQAPGEYEVKGVYIYSISHGLFLFNHLDFYMLFAENDPDKRYLNEIKKINQEIEIPIVFIPHLKEPSFWHQEFKTQVFISESKPKKLDSFSVEETKSIKINPRRIEHKIYILK
jgi:hypothetical protein